MKSLECMVPDSEQDEEAAFRQAVRGTDRKQWRERLQIYGGVGAFTGMTVGAMLGDEQTMVAGALLGALIVAGLTSLLNK